MTWPSSATRRPPTTASTGTAARAGIAALVAVGPLAADYAATAEGVEHLAATAAEAADTLARAVRPGDVVLIKGSRSVGLEAVAAKLRATKWPASSLRRSWR